MSALFPGLSAPVAPAGIDLRCQDVREMLAEVRGARLIHADPPWGDYENKPGVASPEGIYPVLTMSEIASALDIAYDSAVPGARLLMWCCWPLLEDWIDASKGWRWGRLLSGGSWHKEMSQGVGYHWLGRSEPALLYVKRGATPITDRDGNLGNAHGSPRMAHSEKPVDWQREMLKRWTEPDGLVVDLYAGRAPMARACCAEGRRYRGAEIDPERHARALVKLNEYRSLL